MKLHDFSLIIIVLVVVVATAGLLSTKYLGNDNVVEEIAEEVIEDHTGIDVDLSPEEKPTT